VLRDVNACDVRVRRPTYIDTLDPRAAELATAATWLLRSVRLRAASRAATPEPRPRAERSSHVPVRVETAGQLWRGDRRNIMRRTGLFWVAIAGGSIVIGSCSMPSEQEPPRGVGVGTGGAATDARSDDEFVHYVAVLNMTEIELSRMAVARATRPAIKVFAQQLIDDHDAAANQLESLVSGTAIGWPAQLDDKHREMVDELATKHGDDFEREYTEALIDGHQNLAARLESRLDPQSLADWKTAAAGRSRTGELPDPEALRDVQVRPITSVDGLTMKINQWAAEMYPVAQRHLDTARTLENATEKRSSR
jgi:putative membrane protein